MMHYLFINLINLPLIMSLMAQTTMTYAR